jgi:hypothetical protein
MRYFDVPGSLGSELGSLHSSGSLAERTEVGDVFVGSPSTTIVSLVGNLWELTTLTLSRKPLKAV